MKQVIDHIDGDKLNNNLSNLQVTSQRVNSIKSIRNNKYSNYTGVTFDKARGKWVASISINGKKHRMGRFNCEVKAAYAYNQKLKEICDKYDINDDLLARGFDKTPQFIEERQKLIQSLFKNICCKMRVINYVELVKIIKG